MSSESSMGPDGRAPRELKYLPDWLWDFYAQIFEIIFLKGASWPLQLLQAHVVFVPKPGGDSTSPANLRPITILSAAYRVFSSCLFANLMPWHDAWCPTNICGGRPGADALSTAMELGFTLEEAIVLQRKGLIMVSLDLSKFFDSIEWNLILGLAQEFGLPQSYLSAFRRFLQGLQRKLKVGGTFSPEWFTASCGTPQGDALSILWANLASCVLVKSLQMAPVAIASRIYVDDRYLWVNKVPHLKEALSLVSKFDQLAKNRLNKDKTNILCSPTYLRSKVRKITFDGHPLNPVHSLKGLGCTLSSVRKPCRAIPNDRAAKALKTAKRAKSSIAPWAFRKRVLASKIIPRLVYGGALSKPSNAITRSLRARSARLIWGRARSKRATEMVYLTLLRPSRTDPETAHAVSTILTILRGLVQSPKLEILLARIGKLSAATKGLQASFPTL